MKYIGEFKIKKGYTYYIKGDSFELRRKYKGLLKLKVTDKKGSFQFISHEYLRWFGQSKGTVKIYVEEIENLDKYEFMIEKVKFIKLSNKKG